MDEVLIQDTTRTCPGCATAGHLVFAEVPNSVREYVKNGQIHATHLPPSRHYECRNCGEAFILPNWEGFRG